MYCSNTVSLPTSSGTMMVSPSQSVISFVPWAQGSLGYGDTLSSSSTTYVTVRRNCQLNTSWWAVAMNRLPCPVAGRRPVQHSSSVSGFRQPSPYFSLRLRAQQSSPATFSSSNVKFTNRTCRVCGTEPSAAEPPSFQFSVLYLKWPGSQLLSYMFSWTKSVTVTTEV